jgi:probable addiction module antidote protein
MAREADFGLMIWDGKSPGTILNVLRLAIAGKIAVLFNVPEKNVVNIKSVDHWKSFISRCSRALQNEVGAIARERGMSQVARDTGLARESLYRSLDANGNPEFATVLKVLWSIGLRLEAKPDQASS